MEAQENVCVEQEYKESLILIFYSEKWKSQI